VDIRLNSSAHRWLGLALGALLMGGVLSLALVLGRTPGIHQLVGDQTAIRRCLVVHVNLTLGVWFFAFIATLYQQILRQANLVQARVALVLSVIGTMVFTIWGLAGGGEPILSNYIPALDQRGFIIGFAVFVIGVVLSGSGRDLFRGDSLVDAGLPPAVAIGVQTSMQIFLIAVATTVWTTLLTPHSVSAEAYFNTIFWGGGHVFQLANVAVMTSLWTYFGKKLLGKDVITVTQARILYTITLLIPAILSLYWLRKGPLSSEYLTGYTSLMRWTTWPLPAILFGTFAWKSLSTSRPSWGSDPVASWSLAMSAFLLIFGIGLGAFILKSSTLIPAHYHATIGAVTVVQMAMSYVLLADFSENTRRARLSQIVLYGVGQFLFSAGFAFAGFHGLGRKVYGTSQFLGSENQIAGLVIMGLGGVLAVVSGGIFLTLTIRRWFEMRPLSHRSDPMQQARVSVVGQERS